VQVAALFEAINTAQNGHISQIEFSRFLGMLSNYDQTQCFGLWMLFDTAGSVYRRVWMFGVVAALICLLSEVFVYYGEVEMFKNPIKNNYIYQITSVLIGITIVFRTNLSYRRFWEGREQLQIMSSKWGDAALQAVVFDLVSRKERGGSKTELEVRKWRTKICALFSLLHGMALAELSEGDEKNMPVLTGLCIQDVEVLLGQQGVELTADRTFAVLMWVAQELTQAMHSGTANFTPFQRDLTLFSRRFPAM